MGRLCDICDLERPNEAFGGGRGPRSHVCNRCMRMPKQKRQVVLAGTELCAFLGRTHISERNISRIRQVAQHPNPQVAALGTGMLNAVLAAPPIKRKRGRHSVEVTQELCADVCQRWRAAGVLEEENETGEQAVGGDSEWAVDLPF
jgi:hypothetical protein